MADVDPAPTADELAALLEAPDLTPAERRELTRAMRHRRRVEKWEARHAANVPAQPHRVVVSLLMMAICLWVLWLLLGTPGT